MDTVIYVGTVFLTVIWSVWIYLLWVDKAELPEDSGWRFVLIVGPSSFFLLIALSGWGGILLFRIDLVGLFIFNGITLLAALGLLVVFSIEKLKNSKGYKTVILLYYLLSGSVAVCVHVIKIFPPVLRKASELINQGIEIDFFSLAWVGLNPTTHEIDLVSMLNKILIALLSYIPVTIVRFIYIKRMRRKTEKKIEKLEKKVEELERRNKVEA